MCSTNYVFISILLSFVITTKAVLNRDDENFFGETADRYDWSKHRCHRNCTDDEEPKICKYVFVVEQFSAMSKARYDCPFNRANCYRAHCLPADGMQKTIYTVNRQIPGPTIEVCVDDVIVEEVRNNMLSESTTIHWHRIKQFDTQYMDGVPYVTQCPILPRERFRYRFNANSRGTYFWHSHIANEAVLNPNDENFFNHTADTYDWSKHPCHRPCTEDGERMICKYVFVVEQFSTMSKACYDCPFNKTDCFRPHCLPASGVQKTVFTANRQMPGPAIQVCLDDVVMVEVRNNMLSESTTIHWHGIKQTATPYMDGVPYVTQCPILPGERFQYTFNANISGTYFWHSHIGSQRSDGLAGPLIIYSPPSQNLHADLYDYDEHHLIVNDWMNYDGNDAFVKQYHYTPTTVPQTILINGMGRFKEFQRNNVTANVPSSTFKVQKNKRYRLRLINSGAEGCPIAMSIDNHTMLVIALDSNDIEPVEVEVITTWPGERVDFVLKADQESDNYWIRYRGFDQCSPANAENGGVYQVAILRYDGAPDEDPKSPIGYSIPKYTNTTRVLNPYNTGTESSHEVNISIPLLNALTPDDPALIHPVDQQIFIEFDFYPVNNFDFHRKNLYGYNQVSADHRIGSLQLNHITLKLPTFPLLTQWDMLKPNSLCNASHVPGKLNCTAEHCACTHVINLKLNSVVEIVFLDQGAFSDGKVNHPLHLHGHFFRVISEKNLDGVVTVDRIKKLDKEGKVKRRLHRAPLKDTIKSPGGGYTIVRLYANNPGYWFFHCHFEQHTNVGMALIFKVGEHKDFAKIPKDFPKCGGFTPITMK